MSETLKYKSSEIRFGNLSQSGFHDLLAEKYQDAKKIILTDETVYEIWISDLITNNESLREAEIIQIPSGEENKVIEICAHVWNALSEYEISRKDLIINFGGGVITDMGGFIAGTFKRGMPFINIPTTLLSQVDASVGGKTGIDLGPYKNQIGVFADPDYVFIDNRFLNTLEEKELLSGYAEMLKHGLIMDAAYWEELKSCSPYDIDKILPLVQHSVELKKGVVEMDPKESGLRKTLNFGHTIGHGIEGFLLEEEKPVPHGYAIAWGMKAEAYISMNLELITEAEFNDICNTINNIYPKIEITSKDFSEIIRIIQNDKKNEGGKVKFSLLKGIGGSKLDTEVDNDLIQQTLNYLIAD